jgi:hypothetical protein
MEQDNGRVPDGTGLSQAEPQEGLGPSGFDPSRGDLVTQAEFERFNHPTKHWWGIKNTQRHSVTIAFGDILRRQYEAGAPLAEIARFWGKGEHVIRNAMKAAGVVFTGSTRDRDMARVRQVVALRNAGKTLREIGEAFGISRERARQILASEGCEGANLRRVSTERLLAELTRRGLTTARDSDGSPKGGDACGSVHDSAGPKDIAR